MTQYAVGLQPHQRGDQALALGELAMQVARTEKLSGLCATEVRFGGGARLSKAGVCQRAIAHCAAGAG